MEEEQNLGEPGDVLAATVSRQKSLSELLDAIEQRANAATRGPWRPLRHCENLTGMASDTGEVATVSRWHSGKGGPDHENTANATFIAAARSDVPALVNALRRYRQRLQFELDLIVPDSPTKQPGIKQLMFETDSDLAQLLVEPAEQKEKL